jgi:P-type E1-E2 ATPase
VSGEIGGTRYLFGKISFLKGHGVEFPASELAEHDQLQSEGKIAVFLASSRDPLGYIIFSDVIRPEVKAAFASMREHRIKKTYMLTGDKRNVAKRIAKELSIDDYKAELLPEEKVAEVKRIRAEIHPVVMVGDGINDAPALAAADVGIALASHGSSASSEAGDIVIMVNDFMRVHDALHISQRMMHIAKQSIFFGMGVSICLMFIAAFGYIRPVYGALLQEILDAAVILNAMRVNFEKVE